MQAQHTGYEYSEKHFSMVVEGDSMVPDLNPGDVITFDPDAAPRPGSYVVAVGENHATLGKYAERGHDTEGRPVFELIPSNPLYAGMRSDLERIRIIGVALARSIRFE